MKAISIHLTLVVCAIGVTAPIGCGSNPNIEGAKLDLGNRDYDRALENIAIALSEEPDNAEALSVKGQILQSLASETEDPGERAVLFSEMAHAYVRGVEVDSNLAVDHDRRMRMAYIEEFNLGISLYDRAQYVDVSEQEAAFEVAAAHFRNASMIFPDSTGAYFNEASAFYSAGMLQAAIETFELALDRGNTDRQIYVYLAKTLERSAESVDDPVVKQGRYRRLVEILEQAAEEHPKDEELRTMMLKGYMVAGEEDRALAHYELDVAREGNNKIFLYNYGTLLMRLQDYDAAIAMLASAVDVDPDYTNARYNLGAAYINKAVGISENYRMRENEFFEAQSRLTTDEAARRETALKRMDQDRMALFSQAIKHLQVAKTLMESELGDTRDICRALYQAFGQTDQRQKAEEVAACAEFDNL